MIVVYAVALFLFVFEAAYGRRESLKGTRLVAVGAEDGEGGDGVRVNLREREPEAKASRHFLGKVGMAVTVVGLVLNLAQIITRGLAADRWPWGNMFEFVIAICLCGVAAFLFAAMRYRAHYLGAFVLVPVLLLLGIAVRWLYSESGPVVPALDSYWIAIHVSALILATGAFMVSGSATITYLLAPAPKSSRRSARGQRDRAKLPSAELLDRIAHRMIVLAFPLWTFGVIAGAIWADEAWGRYWGWDPKEVWSFITWICTPPTSTRATAGWQGRKPRGSASSASAVCCSTSLG